MGPILLVAVGARGEGEHKLTHEQSLVAPAAPRTAGYPEEPYYDYSTYPETSYQNQAADRQGAEALIAAPLIVTAFSAALFGVHPENLKVRQVESPAILMAGHSGGGWEGGEAAGECTVRDWIHALERRKEDGGGWRDDRTNQRPHHDKGRD